MYATSAEATGAMAGDTRPQDLTVPGGETDPMWYLIAHELVPHVESTFKRGWVEGFVAAMEAARGIDGKPGVRDVLRHSIGMVEEVEVAVRTPSPLRADIESLARFLYERQGLPLEAIEETSEASWDDPAVRDYWLHEAAAILRFLP